MASSTKKGDNQPSTHNVTATKSSPDDASTIGSFDFYSEIKTPTKSTDTAAAAAAEASSKKPISYQYSRLGILKDDQPSTQNVTSTESSLDASTILPDQPSSEIKSPKPIPDEFSSMNISQDKGESSTKIIRVSESSIKNRPLSNLVDSWKIKDGFADDDHEKEKDDSDESSKETKPCDFSMVVRPPWLLKRGNLTLSEKHFNGSQKALIVVSSEGFEIMVSAYDHKEGKVVLSSMRLKASGLEDFTCNMPIEKVVSLKGLSQVFQDAENFNKPYASVAVYSEVGSNVLSFHWGGSPLDFALGFPVNVALKDPEIEPEKFPKVSYTFKAATPSELLKVMIASLRRTSQNRAQHVDMTLRPSSVEQMIVSNVVCSSEVKPEAYEVRMFFQYWESLWHAAHLSDKCTVYLVSEPYQSMILQFDLEELGDMVFLSNMVFLSEGRVVSAPNLPCIGCLPSN